MPFVLLLAAEMVTAFIIYPLKTGKTYYSLMRSQKFVYKRDPVLGFTLKTNYIHEKPPMPHPSSPGKTMTFDVRTNSDGFLAEEDISQMKGKLIFCLGDSVTMASECRHDRTYPAILDSMLSKYGCRCVNAAVGGYRSIHELLFFKNKVLPFKPSAVIIFTGYNDFEDYAYNFYKPYDPFKHCLAYYLSGDRVFFYSAFLHKLERLIYETAGWMRTKDIPLRVRRKLKIALQGGEWLTEWKKNVGAMIDLCKKNDIKCYMLSYLSPTYSDAAPDVKALARTELGIAEEFDDYAAYADLMNSEIAYLCNASKVSCLDISFITRWLSPDRRFSLFFDRMHFTEEGNRLIAGAIYGLLEKDLPSF